MRHAGQISPTSAAASFDFPRLRGGGQGRTLEARQRMSRRWRVVLLRAKGEILGQVEALDAQAAKAAAAVQFELDDFQRNRTIVQELA